MKNVKYGGDNLNDGYFHFIILSLILLLGIVLCAYIIQMHKFNQKLNQFTDRDTITDLWNINKFVYEVSKVLIENKHQKMNYAMVSININKFRYVIENYGYEYGNLVLKQLAVSLTKMLPSKALLSRHNGDRFVLFLPFDNEHDITDYLSKMYIKLEYCTVDDFTVRLSYSSGIYLYKLDHHEQSSTISEKDIYLSIDKADLARAQAKNTVNSYAFFNKEIQKRFMNEKMVEENMEHALSEKEFIIYYQPKYDIFQNKIVGAEALVRWNTKTNGFLVPDVFIPVFEKNDFIIELDFYVLEEVCKLIRYWIDHGISVVPVSVNQSRNHLRKNDYLKRLDSLMKKYQIPKTMIELELTESAFMDLDNTPQFMNDMSEMGFLVSMDDFGSGYSSLNMLNQIPINTLKLDKCFLNELADGRRTSIIMKKIVEMADRLNMQVICEGVENLAQVEFLKSIGCNYAQGYYYAKPMPVDEFRMRYETNLFR
ncbi:MAG: signaling protein [Herbinix sp.]|nr:signaling protein [Herbinix sp.]